MSYRSSGEVAVLWAWMIGFTILVFFISWAGMAIYFDQKAGMNPEIVRLRMEQEKIKRENFSKKKQAYIDGCKASGKAPGDMSDSDTNWSCK
jgi:hypothetical protein